MRLTVRFVAPLALVVALSPALTAQDSAEKINKQIQEELGKIGEELSGRVGKIVGEEVKALTAKYEAEIGKQKEAIAEQRKAIEQHQGSIREKEARIARLESALKQHETRVAELNSKLEALAGAPKKAAEEKPAAPPKSFLGVVHGTPTQGGGAEVVDLFPGGPAEQGGLRRGDVILKIDGADVNSASLEEAVGSKEPGAKITLSVRRGDDNVDVGVTVGDREAFVAQVAKPEAEPKPEPRPEPKPEPEPRPEAQPEPPAKKPVRLGIFVEELDDKRLVVLEVDEGFTGAVAKLEKGDELTKVNGAAVSSLEELKSAFAKVSAGEELSLDVKRGDALLHTKVIAGAEKDEAKLVSETSTKDFTGQPAYLGLRVAEEAGKLEVIGVVPDTGGGAFGVLEKDVILEVNKKTVGTIDDLKAALQGKKSGDTLDMVLRRGDDKVIIKGMRLGAKEEKVTAPEGFAPTIAKAPAKPKEKGYLGLTAQELENGTVAISEVAADGPAAQAKLQKDDLILEVNGVAVKTIDDMVEGLKEAFAGGTVVIVVKRGDDEVNVEVTLGSFPG